MLKKSLLITFFLVIVISIIAQENVTSSLKYFKDIITTRSQIIETDFSDIKITIIDETASILVEYRNNVIREFNLQKDGNITAEKIVSFFLNLEENLLIEKKLKSFNTDDISEIKVISALYEYPFIDKKGNYFVYISDKGTGNRNPFILDLNKLHEKQIIIPETGDYFPVLSNGFLYLLMAVEDGFSLVSYDLETNNWTELKRGRINCLRSYSQNIFYSENNVIYKIDSKGNILASYEFKNPIQSFDINENFIVLSALEGIQYDLFSYNIKENKLIRATNTDFHELDVIFKDENTFVFSSNKMGYYGIFEQTLGFANYRLIYSKYTSDLFYPYYSEYYKKIICSVYEAGKEPYLLIIQH